MPEQNSQNAKAFDPASFSMPDQPSLTYNVIANANQPELSCYVQTVFHRMQGTKSPEARLSDQAPPAIRTSQDMRPISQDAPTHSRTQSSWAAQQAPAALKTNGDSKYQRSSVQFNLSDSAAESTDASFYRPNQNQSLAARADRSNLPTGPRTDVVSGRKSVPAATVLDASLRKNNQSSVAKESSVLISKTKLVALGKDSEQTETPQRDQNTIAKKPEFLKREAFSNKFTVTPSGERKLEKAKSSGKVIYLKSAPAVEHTAKLKASKLVQEKEPQPVAETSVTQAQTAKTEQPQPQVIQWPIVDAAQEQVLFPAPAVTGSPTPMKIDFVTTAPSVDTKATKLVDAETTKIDFAEVNVKETDKPTTDQVATDEFNPFETAEAPDSTFQSSPQQTSPFQRSSEDSSPFQSSSKQTSPFETSPEKNSPFETSPVQSSSKQTSPFETSPEKNSPFETSPVQSSPDQTSPFQTAPDQPSPFESSPFESAPSSSPFESGNNAELSDSKFAVAENQSKSIAAPVKDFTESSTPVSTVFLASNTQDGASDLDIPQVKKDTTAPSQRSDFGSQEPEASSNAQDSSFRVIGHRSTELDTAPTFNANKLEQPVSPTAETQSSKIILPKFKPSAAVQDANQHLTASTLQSGHRSDAPNDQQFEMPWLSPWWMLIGLIPIALYMGTMKLFKDEDEYHSHKNELFGSRLEFGSDFGEPGRSKSDAIYGRQDEVVTAHGPSGEAVRLDGDASQSSLEFAESLQFELPSSKEVAQPSFPQEIRIDQSPNFSQSGPPETSRQNKKQRSTGKKRSNR